MRTVPVGHWPRCASSSEECRRGAAVDGGLLVVGGRRHGRKGDDDGEGEAGHRGRDQKSELEVGRRPGGGTEGGGFRLNL